MSRKNKKKMQTILLTKDAIILEPKYKELTKVTGAALISDYEPLIAKPDNFSESDWIIVNAVEYLNRVDKLYASCSLFCTSDTCPMFNAGPHYHYFWEDESTTDPVQLSTPEYLLQLKLWTKRNLANQTLFPRTNGEPLSANAKAILETVFRRTTRILAHLYLCHFKSVRNFQVEPVINTILAHYTLFALRYKMISPTDVEMLAPVYKAMHINIPGLTDRPETEQAE